MNAHTRTSFDKLKAPQKMDVKESEERMVIYNSMMKSRIVCLGSEGYIPGRLARDLINFLDLRAA